MISLVTLTQNKRPELLERCRASVDAALIPGARHVIIECHTDFAKTRYEATQLDEFVAFVDDDDTIVPDALRWCYDAIMTHGCGIAFTDELMVDLEGKPLFPAGGAFKTYQMLGTHPRAAHHLCLMRASSVSRGALELDQQFGFGIDWFVKASAAFQGDAVFIPKVGYHWTRHDDTMTTKSREQYNRSIRDMGRALRARFPHELGRIPTFDV